MTYSCDLSNDPRLANPSTPQCARRVISATLWKPRTSGIWQAQYVINKTIWVIFDLTHEFGAQLLLRAACTFRINANCSFMLGVLHWYMQIALEPYCVSPMKSSVHLLIVVRAGDELIPPWAPAWPLTCVRGSFLHRPILHLHEISFLHRSILQLLREESLCKRCKTVFLHRFMSMCRKETSSRSSLSTPSDKTV